ncbi:MAG TPA: Ig-like domain repeat protein, partial [Acidimicrobiales bacterium]
VTPTPGTTTYGNESTVSFGVTVNPQFPGAPTGSVTVMSGSTPVCNFTLVQSDNGVGSCNATSNTVLGAGSPSITAAYAGDANFGASPTSPPSTLAIDQDPTTASVTPTPGTTTYGNESTVSFGVTVTPQFPGAPTGSVTVMSGSTPLCTVTLVASDNGSGSCTTGNETLLASTSPYAVTATYDGDTNFSASMPSPSSPLTVMSGNSTTQLTLSSPSVTYGHENVENFTVNVTPLKAGTPQGTVTVAVPGTQLCSGTLGADGSFECSVASDTALGASTTTYTVTATFDSSNNSFFGSATSSSLTVTQATTGTALQISPSSVTYASESAATFTASLTPQYAGTPTGFVTIAVGATTLCSITLPATHCSSTNQSALGAGNYNVTASYHGNPNFKSSSGGQGFTVDQATPSGPDISNVPAGATEEGGFTASVATNGDGATSVVSDTTATCTVGGDGRTVSFLVEGACTLTPQVSSGTNYTAGAGSPQTFTILPGPRGYWLVGSDGGIFSFGQAHFYGSMGGIPLQRPVVGITPTHDKHGYWLVASDGGIFSFGDSNFYGSIPGLGIHPAGSGQAGSLDAPIVGMVPSSDGNGYFMVASDGGVFAFGDARFAGSCPGIGGCAGTAVAVMPDHSGNGYWLVTSAGNIYAFGDAPFFGAPSPQSSPVVNAVATIDGNGYWILYANGTVLPFGDASSLGNPLGYVNSFNPATSIFPTSDGLGYWVAAAKGDVFSYGNAPFLGSMSSTPLNGPIIAAFGF